MRVCFYSGDEVKKLWAEANGLKKCLKLMNIYRNRERFVSDEEEYLANLINTVVAGLEIPSAKLELGNLIIIIIILHLKMVK